MTDYTAMDWARDTLKSEQPTSTEFAFDALKIEYSSTFLPEGTYSICTTEEDADKVMAALIFSMSGSEKDRSHVYEWYKETLIRFESDSPAHVRSEFEVHLKAPGLHMVMVFGLSKA